MEEQRRYAILFAATLLCVRQLIDSMESDKPDLAQANQGDCILPGQDRLLDGNPSYYVEFNRDSRVSPGGRQIGSS